MQHTILQGDCLRLLPDMPDGSVDALITDPPYSSGGQFRGDRAAGTGKKYVNTGVAVERADFSGDNRDQRAYFIWCALWLGECQRVLKPGSPVCLFTDWRQLPTTIDAFQIGGFIWRGIVPWNKTEAARPQYGRFRSQCEYIVWGSNGPMNNDCAPLPGFFTYVVRQDDKFHQTGKPTSLMMDILKIVKPGGVVLDPFAGSCTTALACELTGRNSVNFELLKCNIDIGKERLEEAKRNPALLPHPTQSETIAQAGMALV